MRLASARHVALSLLTLSLAYSTLANTEIINFRAPEPSVSTFQPAPSAWPTLDARNSELPFVLNPAPLGTPLLAVCEHDEPPIEACENELWAVLDLDDVRWAKFGAFTLRASIPASHPADFLLEVYTPEDIQRRLSFEHSVVPSSSPPRRTLYARIRASHTGVAPSPASVPPPAIPFRLALEPLYFGAVPASTVPIGAFVVFVAAAALYAGSAFVVPELERLAEKTRIEMREGAEKGC
ncbi:hypothetical protein K488DRAFT_82383 [Vararia minispora EC-137]|uniref:Uncharacterized protein n=1 Tax=Vararia minispora EC-137 TaxID=1314806 RepID=A0ACB8QWT3_9AGAM|nr:hypothetical protein K488DRAFT_82383 [Vararia minispora EC-137]